jgi:hypothetical protein
MSVIVISILLASIIVFLLATTTDQPTALAKNIIIRSQVVLVIM